MEKQLIGIWKSDDNDSATMRAIGKVKMIFSQDGKLTYDIYENEKIQRINLVYKVNDNIIISNQPSHPQEQITKFSFENPSTLILEFNGKKTIFYKEK